MLTFWRKKNTSVCTPNNKEKKDRDRRIKNERERERERERARARTSVHALERKCNDSISQVEETERQYNRLQFTNLFIILHGRSVSKRTLMTKMSCQRMLLNFLLGACWITSSFAVSNIGCPDVAFNTRHYLATFRNTCYVFINTEKFWNEARDYCWWLGGELVHIHNMETMEFLKSILDSKELGWNKNGVWIGASDDAKEGHWIWTTGEEVTWSYWAKGQPKTWPFTISFEDCAQMRRSEGWRWHDYTCNLALYHYNSICQFPLKGSSWGKPAPQSAPSEETVISEGNVLGIVISLAAAVMIIMGLIMLYYRRWLKKKYVAKEPAVLFQNTSYAQIHNAAATAADGSTSSTLAANNSYWNTNKVNMLYEKVNKQVNHGVNDIDTHFVSNCNNLDKSCDAEEGAAALEKFDKVNLKAATMKVKVMNTELHAKMPQEDVTKENPNLNTMCEPKLAIENTYEDTLYAKK